jgi:hypothetical protein
VLLPLSRKQEVEPEELSDWIKFSHEEPLPVFETNFQKQKKPVHYNKILAEI